MYSVGLVGAVLVIIIIWLAVLTYLILTQGRFLRQLVSQDGGDLKSKLVELLREIKSLEEFKRQSFKAVQKVGLKRYNPYKDTGGNVSFSVALLNGRGDGIVMTSLHARAGTRFFAKGVKAGKEDGVEFSQEEKEIIKQAFSG